VKTDKVHNGSERRREELERSINDAADGLLSALDIKKLEEDLAHFPDLYRDYRDIMGLPPLSKAYGAGPEGFRNDLHVHRIRQQMEQEWEQTGSFEEIAITWFKKYALAAALLIFGFTSLAYLFLPQMNIGQEDMTVQELLYPYEESYAEAYVLYLDELIEQ